MQLGNPEQDRGAGFLEPAFDGQKLAVSNADRDLSVAGAEDAVLGDGGGLGIWLGLRRMRGCGWSGQREHHRNQVDPPAAVALVAWR